MRPLLVSIVLCLSAAVPHFVKGEFYESNPCEIGAACLNVLADESFSSADGEEEMTSSGPCHPNPCHNRGICEISETYRGDTFIGYVCKCPTGFNGIHCQHSKLDDHHYTS
uniref:EGF-like domain-containing protein n=1 Tax=Hucho hucho TaxID=62062 RepID=A0A4W5Q5N9_9TELE